MSKKGKSVDLGHFGCDDGQVSDDGILRFGGGNELTIQAIYKLSGVNIFVGRPHLFDVEKSESDASVFITLVLYDPQKPHL